MSIRWAYLKRVAAGAIFGLYMAHLLYFLNPQVDITPGRLLTVTLVYGAICGLLFGSILWVFRILRVALTGKPATADAPYRPHGFGFVVLAAFISSAIYWIHLTAVRPASTATYLPIAAIRVLAIATNVITATAFVLLILWFFERNADRQRSRVTFVAGLALVVVSSFFLYQRRESYRTERRSVVFANIGTVAERRPVVVVAIRNLPYDWIVTMTGEGLLPFFERASQNAYFTRLEPFPATSPKALWASLATGKLPYRHGVTGRYSYRTLLSRSDPSERFLLLPSGVGFQVWGLLPPVTRISAPLPAGDAMPLWGIFERVSLHAALIGWPATGPRDASYVVLPRTIQATANRSATAAQQQFDRTGRARERIVTALADDLATVEALCSDTRFDVRVAALEGFSEAQRALHIFLNDLPPRTSVKGEALRTYAQRLDHMIESIVAANPDSVVIICSPSGVVPPTLPASAWLIASQALSNADPGADDGFMFIAGAGVAHRPNPAAAFVVDVVPTALFAAGLPVGRDMDGRVLTDAFDDEFLRRNHLSAIQTYEANRIVVRRAGA